MLLVTPSLALPILSNYESAPIRDRWEWGNCQPLGLTGDVLAESHTIIDTAGHFIVDGHTVISQLDCNALVATDVGGVAYLGSSTPDSSIGDLIITTIYGLNLDPTGTVLEVTGFDSIVQSLITITDTTFFGNSGTTYAATFNEVHMLAELPALLPGFDLSPFQGNPSSIVYIFQTTVPAYETLQVPEPPTLACLALGGLLLMGSFKRRYEKQQEH